MWLHCKYTARFMILQIILQLFFANFHIICMKLCNHLIFSELFQTIIFTDVTFVLHHIHIFASCGLYGHMWISTCGRFITTFYTTRRLCAHLLQYVTFWLFCNIFVTLSPLCVPQCPFGIFPPHFIIAQTLFNRQLFVNFAISHL